MNFQQLRILRECLRCNLNLTEVANALATSQSGVSKHIRDLEEELGVELFVRRGKRLTDITEPGREIAAIAARMLMDAENIRRVAHDLGGIEAGTLTLATTHMQARYALPPVIARFRKAYPQVQLVLHQSSPSDIARELLDGRADIGVATEAVAAIPDLVAFPYYSWRHGIVVPKGHPLAREALSLQALAQFPLITYQQGFTGRPVIDRAFEEAGLAPSIVMEAIDSDVIKAYVEMGLGVGIVAEQAFDPARDLALDLLTGDRLFAQTTSYLALRRGRFLRGYGYRFLEACRSDLTEAFIRKQSQRDA